MGEEQQDTINEEQLAEAMQVQELAKYLSQSGAAPQPEEKYNVHLFLHRVATADDTTKVGFLTEQEVGKPKYPVRALKEMALISREIVELDDMAKYFEAESEIITSSSLSREGFLVRQATTTTKQIADVTKKPKAPNKSWFKKKDNTEEQQLQS